MSRCALLVATMVLAACPMAYGKKAATDLTNPTRTEAARTAEEDGDMARAREDYLQAIFYYDRALRNDRGNAHLYNKLGIAQLELGNRSDARGSFNRANKIEPQNADVLNNLGAVACIDKKYKPAVRYLKRALALDEPMPAAHLNMAEAWMGLGDVDHAMNEYARALELDPDILDSSRNGTLIQLSTPEQRARMDFLIATAYARRGNRDRALEYLRLAKEGHCPFMSKVYTEKEFAMLWTDPRLQQIVKR
jgi:tetratricopeptide (TPR) repeat protein